MIAGMAGKRRDDVREEEVTGLKYFDKLAPMLARLHDVGCERDKAGNRNLHYDQRTDKGVRTVFRGSVHPPT